MTTSVVTGGAGFIGSHLVDRLLAEGDRVIVLDNLATGREENLAGPANDPRFSLETLDIAGSDRLGDIVHQADHIYHLAALADIVPSIDDPVRYHRANVEATLRVLEAGRSGGIKRFIYAASSSCYGIPDVYPTPESAPPRPMHPYALTKWIGEQYVLHWGNVYGLPVVSLRLFNVYGPRSRTSGAYGAVFGVFLAQKLAGEPFTVVGEGTQSRDFVFVTDVAEAFQRAGSSDVAGETMNVGAGRPRTIMELVGLLGGDVTHIPKRPGEPDRTHADISKIRRLLAWSPRVPFADGVAAMLRGIDAWSEAPVWTAESIAQATEGWFRHLGDDPASG